MARPNSHLTDEEVTEFDADKIAANQAEVDMAGLPDLPGKARLSERTLDITERASLTDAHDSLTQAVGDNMRVGVGTPAEDSERAGDEQTDAG